MIKTGGSHPETLPASWYTDSDIHQRELNDVWAKNWTVVARADQLVNTGDFVCDEVAGRPVFVVRAKNGELRAFHNVCRHRAGPVLREAAGHCQRLHCSYHGWSYDFDGGLVMAPGFSKGREFDPDDFHLFAVRVESWNGVVWVCLDEAAPGLIEWLGDIADVAKRFPPATEMAFFDEVIIEGDANWKLYGDNGVEFYHGPFVHTVLKDAVEPNGAIAAPHANGKFVGFEVKYAQWGEHQPGPGYWILKFPCVLIHFTTFDFNLEQVIPLGPDRLRLRHWFWFPKEDVAERREDCEQIVADWRLTMGEDLDICAEVQRNLQAGMYETGRLSPEKEPGTIFYQSLARDALGAADS